jgi:hypothetical protein
MGPLVGPIFVFCLLYEPAIRAVGFTSFLIFRGLTGRCVLHSIQYLPTSFMIHLWMEW